MSGKTCIVGLAGVFVAAWACQAAWMEGFEGYPIGSIHGQGSRWQVSPSSVGAVTTASVHSGGKALEIVCPAHTWGSVTWSNQTGTLYGGLVSLSWWMDPGMYPADTEWGIDVGVTELFIWKRVPEYASIAVWTDHGDVFLYPDFLPPEGWTQVAMELDLDASPDRFRLLGGVSGPSPWFNSMWGDRQYFDSFSICSSTDYGTHLFIDDISVQSSRETAVPEPSILVALTGLLATGLIGHWWRRRQKAA